MSSIIFSKIISSIGIPADKSPLSNLTHNHKLLQILHQLLSFSLYCTLYFLNILLSLYPITLKSFNFLSLKPHFNNINNESNQLISNGDHPISYSSSTSIGRALTQILTIMNQIPVSSRKYELVRSLAENLIDENLKLGFDFLREINCVVLSSAFSTTLCQLEDSVMEEVDVGFGPLDNMLNRFFRPVRSFGDSAWFKFGGGGGVNRADSGLRAEKFAAELLWLAKKMSACGNGEVAVLSWGSASRLAWLSLSAEPRLQGSLVKVSAFLLKEAKEMGKEKEIESEQLRQIRLNLLMSWLPFLCRASNGTDAPVLSNGERVEVEKVIEDIIEMLRKEDEQEKVLNLWLQHFTSCSLSDWPNLQTCYSRWCESSRKLLLIS